MSLMNEEEKSILSVLERLEMEQASMGIFEPVSIDRLAAEVKHSIDEVRRIIISLLKKRQVIYQQENDLVRSRIGHIVKCLFLSRYHSRRNPQGTRNISDLKYIRYVKQIPKYVEPLSGELRNQLIEILGGSENSFFQRILTNVISSVATRFPKLSIFQRKASLSILSALRSPSQGNSLALVADTGAGKTLAYQFPLVLWIVAKKLQRYIKKEQRNTTAILIFPRNVLAQNQLEEIRELVQYVEHGFKVLKIPTRLLQDLRFKIEKDFGGVARDEQIRIYTEIPDVIVTLTQYH